MLLLRRARDPNRGFCSPIGGKLDTVTGESPAHCAQREIREEAGIDVPLERLHLLGLISEQAPDGHWLLFYFRVVGPVEVQARDIDEGRLDWHRPDELDNLPIPETDRRIIWPLVTATQAPTPGGRDGFFSVHLDLMAGGLSWQVHQILPGTAGPPPSPQQPPRSSLY
jgi:8-oxo-dGTP diphosphatase